MALQLKSQRQIKAQILSSLISQLGLNDINPGSVLDVLTDAIAQADFSQYYQIAQVSRLTDLNALTGIDLQNKGFEYGLFIKQPEKATGTISIYRDSTFVKVSTSFYTGSPAAIAGDTSIDVNDASNSLISTSGTLIIGRGTNNEEEVSYSVVPTNNVTYWRFTLNSPLAKDHALDETVILKQGANEVILAGTTIVVPPTGVTGELQFQTEQDITLLAGEFQIDNVGVKAVIAGTSGNITIGAIDGESAFAGAPFLGARARNLIKFTTGKDLETDDEFRDRIKNYIQGITKAVKQAILNAIVGLVDPETAKRVVSASVVLPLAAAGDVKVYIDDGTGFEPSFLPRGYESVLAQSTGGEQRLQIDKFPIVKAYVESNTEEPYNMSSGNLTLTYQVSNISETITFQPIDFSFPEIVTAEQIVSLINDRSNLLEARTSQIGKHIYITSKVDSNEDIQVTGGTANAMFNFPTDLKSTLSLYIDDVKISKDGETALLDSQNTGPFNLIGISAFPHTLTIVIDGKTANSQTATINTSDVVNTAAVTVPEVVSILNRDLAGVTATAIENNTKIRLTSLTKLSSGSKLHITGGSLNNSIRGLNFSTTQVIGANGDYKLNRELGIIELTTPLTANKTVSAGSKYTRAKFIAVSPELYSPANGETLDIQVDSGSIQTITFNGTFIVGKTATQTAVFINETLKGGVASVRSIGNQNYLQIESNTYLNGTLKIKNTSTGNNSFGFTLETLANSDVPTKAFRVSGNPGPFTFVEADSLVIVLNDDIANSTYSVLLNYAGVVSSASSGSSFNIASLGSVFPTSNIINNYYVAFKTGVNTASSDIVSVILQGAGIARYVFGTTPVTIGNFQIGDLFKCIDLVDAENNGHFIISGIGLNYVDVSNPSAIAVTLNAGTGTLAERRRITSYNNLNGQITTNTSFSSTPGVSNTLILIPSTIDNLLSYINNSKISSINLKANIEGVNGNTKLQISSKQEGSDGYVQITGGTANQAFGFSTVIYRGLASYAYWTGLLPLVHKTIYGDDSDLAAFPGVGAAGIVFRVLAPTVNQVAVNIQVVLSEGASITALENDIKSAITSYINTLGVSQDVIIERIRAAVISIPGITDVIISNPSANIVIADNEKAVISEQDIVIG